MFQRKCARKSRFFHGARQRIIVLRSVSKNNIYQFEFDACLYVLFFFMPRSNWNLLCSTFDCLISIEMSNLKNILSI